MQQRAIWGMSTRGWLWLFPSSVALLFGLLFWAYLLFMPLMMNGDGDLGRHITVGTTILDTGHLPTSDRFSHTMAGAPVVAHEWLSQLLFALAHRAAGLNGVAWLTAGVLATTYALLAAGMRRLGVRGLVAFVAAFVAAIAGWLHALTRPHIFTLLLFTVFLLVLEHYRRTRRGRWLLVLFPLMVLWANLHGAFLTGLVLVALYGVGMALDGARRQAGTLALVGGGLLLASWLNPAGPTLLTHSSGYLGERLLVDLTVEYRSPDFHTTSTWPFAALLLATLALGWRGHRRQPWTPLLVMVVWTAFALYSARNIPLYAQAVVPLLAWEADRWLKARAPVSSQIVENFDAIDQRAWGWMWVLLVVALLVGAEAQGARLDVLQRGNRFDPQVFPVAALDQMGEALPDGAMFNELAWGGYLLYRLWPERTVFIDGQTDFYGEALTREYLRVLGADDGWEEVLDAHDVQWIILPPQRPVARWLDQSPQWERRYRDDVSAVWVRRQP